MSSQTKPWRQMAPMARVFISLVVAAGAAVLFYGVFHWSNREFVQLSCYLLIAILASRMKVKLPGITGTMSASFLVILLSLVELGLAETLIIACTTTLVQSLSKDQPRLVQLLFNVCASAIAVGVTDAVYRFLVAQRHSSQALALVAAACAYFIANTLPVSTIISLTEDKSLRKTWKECYFWAFPYYLLGAGFAGLLNWLSGRINWQVALLLIPGVYLIYRSYRLYLGKLEAEKKHAEQMAKLHLRTIEVLALAIEAKDQTTHAHLQRVRVYAAEIAKELNVEASELEALQAAALLHDIGKLAVPEHIISKPGKLTPEEFEKMKIHPLVGAQLLEKVEFPYPVAPIVRAHHEKWDGSGYPFGLKGEQIPIGARILAAVDFLDALASDRQYRQALPMEEVANRLAQESGKSFDPRVVDVICRRYRQLEKLVQKRASKLMEPTLTTGLAVENGAAPAAGFEASFETGTPTNESTFLDSIAAAKQEVQILFELGQELGTSLSLDDTLSVFAAKLRRLVAYDSIVIYIRYNDVLVPEYVSGESMRRLSALRIPLGEGVSGWVALNNKPMINGNPLVESGYHHDSSQGTALNSALSVPLQGIDSVVGAVTLYRSERDAFSKDHLRVLLAVSSKMALAIENAIKYQQAESSATTDYLTGLPNARSMFLQVGRELARAKREGGSVTVMVCDLDGFKQVNDRFGHLEGNRVLQLFARRLKESCREYDYVARMGGDEFVMMVPNLALEDARPRAAQLREVARESGHAVCGEDLLSVSVGIAIYPDDASDMDSLLAEADRRMYAEKQHRSGKKNRRGHPRLTCSLPVELSQEGDSAILFGRVSNVSAGGCFIELGAFVGTATRWCVSFATSHGPLRLVGTVVRSNPGVGIGLKFDDLALMDRAKVQQVLELAQSTVRSNLDKTSYLTNVVRAD